MYARARVCTMCILVKGNLNLKHGRTQISECFILILFNILFFKHCFLSDVRFYLHNLT